ncbi:L,D-transpeptidase family protein [Bradyrhizobium sp. INPA01-394B]|uniref:L,D-transpeptidase family protein n=1 Tax=Bradyrhizobium campsiandrae TaxID=1729892 RepID=A0ABR7UKY6_9BRAD|nr:L,D-transpeptidase [Bradyrhizobium campsiandrae]MBC9883813.1 L,D-transpeptidase family protein [Bradyrhizobium campsiandrae]MBC9984604.1 L,D-transpeptidase family protein [Bradyrhizobium campsiandrae]
MIKHFLTICAAATVAAAGTSLAQAQSYPVQQVPSYGAPAEYRPGDRTPNFDALDEDDDAMPQAALPPPGPAEDPRYARPAGPPPVYSAAPPQGPVMSPDDPRYGRPAGAPPVYSAAPPQGPVMSPDDPRYGRPAGPPPVIYGDRSGQAPANDGMRPPEAVGSPAATGAVTPQPGGRPTSVAALPPEEQPDAAPVQLAPNLRRQEVAFQTKEPAGTIVVDTPNTYLYYVLGNGRAIRYGVRVGRDGFTWTGVQKITRKAEWPDWHPPAEMIERQPYLPRFMAGGEGNPLGARAMYLGSTVYRIHGTNQPSTIGKFVSSGCIGMLNEDVSDLFDRAKVGTRVVVMPGNPPAATTTASAAPAPGPAPMAAQAGPVPGTQPTVVPPLPAPVTVR